MGACVPIREGNRMKPRAAQMTDPIGGVLTAARPRIEKLLGRLNALEPRGTPESTLGAMTDLLLADTGAHRVELDVWHNGSISVSSGSDNDVEGWYEQPITFGSAKIGTVRLHGSHLQVETWRSSGFSTVATLLGGLVTAHLSHGAAARAVASRDQLLASVSHELRTPITFISGIVTELTDGNARSEAERRSLLEMIAEQSADMEKIVEDLLAGAQVDADRLRLTIEPIDLVEQAVRVAESARIDLAGAAPSPSIAALGDVRRVRQIIRNLLTNARRYGGPTITVVTFRDLRRAYLAVCDDGPPIPAEQRRHLFEDFARVETSRHHPASVGIGLSVSKRLASLMGGSLGYEHDGRLSRFILGLPVATPPAT